MADSYGIDVERRRREIAVHHGVPDFVFRSLNVDKVKGQQREIGDFLLWAGDTVVIVSSKSREPHAASRETQERRQSWLTTNVAEAYGQIKGVARNLKYVPPGQIILESERGVRVPWDATSVTTYLGVVVVEIPPTDNDFATPLMTDDLPTVTMLGRDWDALNAVLPSTRAMIRYIDARVSNVPRCPLGSELDIFALILNHQHEGTPVALPHGGLPKGYFDHTVGSYPNWFLGGDPEDHYAFVVNAMIEGAADFDPALSNTESSTSYMTIIDFLDRIPLLERVSFGRAVVERCARAGREGERITSLSMFGHGMLIFVTDDGSREDRTSWLQGVTLARHSQALDAGAPLSLTTLGVATQQIPATPGRSHDFCLIQGGIRSDETFRVTRDALYGNKDWPAILERLDT
jgi:hypothetical protein